MTGRALLSFGDRGVLRRDFPEDGYREVSGSVRLLDKPGA